MNSAVRAICLILVFIMIFFPMQTIAQDCGLAGDVNGDGKLGLDEAIYILQVMAGVKSEFPDDLILFLSANNEGCEDPFALHTFIYDISTKTMDTIKNNCSLTAFYPVLSPDGELYVYAEGPGDMKTSSVKLYNIVSRTTYTIEVNAVQKDGDGAAAFNSEGKILFINHNDGLFKKMDVDGTNISSIATPDPTYSFTMFWVSPDRQKVAILERKSSVARLLMMNPDGTDRETIKGDWVGDFNHLSWKTDSSGFLFYYHLDTEPENTDQYLLVDISVSPVTVTDLSNSDLGKPDNPSFATKYGNFIGIISRELYNGQTGEIISDRQCDVPSIMEKMWGIGNSGEIYFADQDGSNVRIFIE